MTNPYLKNFVLKDAVSNAPSQMFTGYEAPKITHVMHIGQLSIELPGKMPNKWERFWLKRFMGITYELKQ